MSIVKLAGIKKLFGGSALTRAEQKQLAKEVLLMTLARATASDSNIKSVDRQGSHGYPVRFVGSDSR
jgi:hypothetical protein